MRAIVIGAGKVGYHIAQKLAQESHDVVLVDSREQALIPARDSLDVLTIMGNGASPKTLEAAGVAYTDMLIAVTTHDEVNIIACLTAKHYGVETTVARVRNPDYTMPSKALVHGLLGIDLIIHPERLAALEITKLLKTPTASEVGFYADGRVELLGIRCDTPGATCLNKPLHLLKLKNSLVVAVERDGELLVPDGNTKLRLGDYFYVLGKTGDFERSTFLAGRIPSQIRSVTLVGGGETGLLTCETLSGHSEEGLSLTLIEQNPERARYLAERLPDVLVINGDGADLELLRSEQVGASDALVAITRQEQTNLLIAMAAKELGVKEVIVELGREQYGPLAETVGVHAVVIPRLLTASTILRLLQKDRIVDLAFLKQGRAEVMEVAMPEEAPVLNRPLKYAGLPKNALIGTIIRDNEIIIPHGDSEIHAGDRVIAFSHIDASPALRKHLGL